MTKNIVITGANRGIGLAFVKQYRAAGCNVFAVCRNASDALRKSGAKIIEGIDVTDLATLPSLAEGLQGINVDILINNAGVLHGDSFGYLNFEEVMEQLEVNALGPLKITQTLLPNLKQGAKVAMITSRMGSVSDNGSGAYYGYRMSKAALNAAGKSLANDLAPKGIAVALLHPGFVQTEMVNNAGDISPEAAASRLFDRIEQLNLENTGSFWHSNGEILPW